MARLSELKEVLFPVALAPLTALTDEGHELPVENNLAVVDTRSHRVLSVVSSNYRLISHSQALDWAYKCARAAFPNTSPSEWGVALVDAPASGSTCFLDLQHNSAQLEFSGVPAADKPDLYGPFVRVVNSYNHTRVLSFEIGYYRKVCSNGLIARDTVIRFRMNHLRRDIADDVEFEIASEKLDAHRAAFQGFLARLQAHPVPVTSMGALACAALGFEAPAGSNGAAKPESRPREEARMAAWHALEALVEDSCARHARELGANAYALLNAITDVATRPPVNLLVRRDRHSLQRRAGAWLGAFVAGVGGSG